MRGARTVAEQIAEGSVVTLASLRPGTVAQVVAIERGHGAHHRLAELGLRVGSRVVAVRGTATGPMIVEVLGTRLVLGRGLAWNIMVRGM